MEQISPNASISYMLSFIKTHKKFKKFTISGLINSQMLLSNYLVNTKKIDRKVKIKWILSEWFNVSYTFLFNGIYFYLQE